jgi:hypothetical protein
MAPDDVAERTSEPRVILNIDTEDAAELVERIEPMGVGFSVRLEDRGPGIFPTFEDPDGNVTQVLRMTRSTATRSPDREGRRLLRSDQVPPIRTSHGPHPAPFPARTALASS